LPIVEQKMLGENKGHTCVWRTGGRRMDVVRAHGACMVLHGGAFVVAGDESTRATWLRRSGSEARPRAR